MTTFFTSDTHFGHERIISLSNRPFRNVDEMNKALVDNWNAVVGPDDHVYHLGDVALGKIAESLPLVGELNGIKHLVVGNHDRLFIDPEAKRLDKHHRDLVRWREEYAKYFQYIEEGVQPGNEDGKPAASAELLLIPEIKVNIRTGKNSASSVLRMSHFPYTGDSHDKPRYDAIRPKDDGKILLHGHTHQDHVLSKSAKGTQQIHVGVDSWDYAPVSLETILRFIRK